MNWEDRPGKRILVVEHDALTRGAIKLLLEWEDYRVACAADGAEALELLRRGERPSLILLNVRRPGCDGWCFREEQRADPDLAHIPVVVLSGADASSLDAAGHLRKPFEPQELLEQVWQHG
jgi:two-component system, chemotaxis family, chemotaxis protein CheY